MLNKSRSSVFRVLAAALMATQVALGGLAALPHEAAIHATVSLKSADDGHAPVAGDEQRCALCRFASQPATALPSVTINAEPVIADALPVAGASALSGFRAPLRPLTRAPPILSS